MKRLWFLALVGSIWAQPMFVDPHYTADLIFSSNGLTCIDFDSAGRLYAAEKRGIIFVFQPNGTGGFQAPTTFANLMGQLNFSDESGLLGLAIDPEFATTRHVFVFYTTDTDQRLARLTANPSFTAMEPGSEVILLDGLPRLTTIHKAGDLEFSPDDDQSIFLSLGDDDQGGIPSNGTTRAQDPDSYIGKILRVSKDNGQGVTSNPFWDGNPDSIRSRVWAVGFRNPFRFTFHPNPPVPDVLYNSENGDGTDRISWVQKGSNGEWNGVDINPNGFGFLNPTDPNHRILATTPPSLLGIAIADSGPFAPGGPTMYVANWLSGIRRWNLTGPDQSTAVPIASDGGQVFTDDIVGTDMVFGPDGNLYTSWSGGGDSLGGFYTVWRIRFSGVDPPVASFTTNVSPPRGPAPLTIAFSDTSSAPGSALTQWEWDFGDGNFSNLQNPMHTFSDPGSYTVQLTVRNTEGLVDSTTQVVSAFRSVSVTLSGTIFDGRTLPESALVAATEIRFYQTADLAPIPIAGGTGPEGNGLAVNSGVVSGAVDLEITSDGFIVSAGEPAADAVGPAWQGIAAPPGQPSLNIALEFFLSDRMVQGRIFDYRNQPVTVDVGLAKTTATNWIEIAGGRDYLPASGITPTGIAHRRSSDDYGYYHLPIPASEGDATYHLQAVADTQADVFAARTLTQAVTGPVALDIQLARFSGGIDCDDLSGIPETAAVDYETQIQPIFSTSCTGCHHPGATNSGGLNLQAGSSLGNLVEVPSSFALGLMRVRSGEPNRSFLLEKINCASPQTGNRMRPSNAMSLEDQALIRDWIAQLNSSCLDIFRNQLPNWPAISVQDLMSFVCP